MAHAHTLSRPPAALLPASTSIKSRCRCVATSAALGRRDALLAASALVVLSGSSSCRAGAAPLQEKDPAFYVQWPYAAPADILPYIKDQASPGDAQAILDAMDAFSEYYPQYKIGPEKGQLLERVLQQVRPSSALEVGTFFGYSAIRIARQLPPQGRLLCIEANPAHAAVAREVLGYAGMDKAVQVLDGLSGQIIPTLPAILQQRAQQQQQQQQQGARSKEQPKEQQAQFDFVFLDHCKECYAPDLQALEQLGLVARGTTVMADNVVYPGAPGFLEYLNSRGYQTELLRAKYEYEQVWNPSWELGKDDALSVSVCPL